jgi:hypothetical protein
MGKDVYVIRIGDRCIKQALNQFQLCGYELIVKATQIMKLTDEIVDALLVHGIALHQDCVDGSPDVPLITNYRNKAAIPL